MQGIAQGAQPISSYNFGARNTARVKQTFWLLLRVCLLYATALWALIMRPEQAATTHPALLCALCRMLCARGASVVLGDSPGGLYNAAHVGHVYEAAGMCW